MNAVSEKMAALQRKLDYLFHHPPRECLLCYRPVSIQGFFIPPQPELWGAKPGKGKIYQYGVCGPCSVLQDVVDRVEAVIQEYVNSQATQH